MAQPTNISPPPRTGASSVTVATSRGDSTSGPPRSDDVDVTNSLSAADVATLTAGGVAAAFVQRRTIAGYEILGELGRGGMGVVYKARQVGLNRLVALKMILAGGHAAAEDLQRFRAEAEAVARLAAPEHRARSYEVGEHDGLPYFSLEFVDGGSLDRRLAGDPHAAARRRRAGRDPGPGRCTTPTTAGIVHRDLKPANILLAADGHAQDHRLRPGQAAGRRTSRPDADRSGARHAQLHGPGAGRGDRPSVGPAADVYAPRGDPVRAAHRPAAVLGSTRAGHAGDGPHARAGRRRRALRRACPRDLETICLKCLQKEPGKAVRHGRRAGRRPAALPRRRADPGATGQSRHGKRLARAKRTHGWLPWARRWRFCSSRWQ